MPPAHNPSEPLSPVDTAWFHMEDPTNLMMVTGVLLFDEPLPLDSVRAVLEERLLRFDRFRQRVVEPRMLGGPHWKLDPHFDIRSHLHRVALPSPGDQRALEALVSDLMSTPLDYTKPLWQAHVIEGFGKGSAFLLRLHHAIADGVALVHVLLSMTDETPTPPRVAKPAVPLPKRPRKESALEAFLHEGFETLLHPSRVLDYVRKGTEGATVLEDLILMSPDSDTVFKGKLGVQKRAAWSAPLPLEDVKAVGKATGGTVNDVLLTAMTGALRSYVQKRGGLVDGLDIRAVVPVNLRPPAPVPELGNRFGLVFLSLPVGIEDPLERLLELKERMDGIKDSPEAVVAFGILNAMGLAPEPVESQVIDLFAKKATAVMTNVPGPKKPIYLAGAPVTATMFWVPQSGRLGLGVSILSYAGTVRLGLATDAGLVPDPETIAASFKREFQKLERRAGKGR